MTTHILEQPAVRQDTVRPNRPLGGLLGRIGTLHTRLACSADEVAAAQALRYAVFFEERGAVKSMIANAERRDIDRFDSICDHLMVIDTSLPGPDTARIVGTYRLLPQDRTRDGFYSAAEFDVGAMVARHPNRRFLELGRSCVLPVYRSRRTAELLWQGVWAYCLETGHDVLMGCASFPGVVPAAHALALSYLHHNHRPEPGWQARAQDARHVDMDLMPAEAIRLRDAVNAMPPLIKGYLRLGSMIGDGCVVDHDFGTTDILIVLPTEVIPDRYIRHYGADASRFAA